MIATGLLSRAVLTAAFFTWYAAAAVGAQAASVDCAKAGTRSEQAICSDPDLAAADAAMARAYRSLWNALPPDQRGGLLRDQQEWLKSRDRNCAYDPGNGAFAKCLAATSRFRTKFLSVAPLGTANGATIAPNLFHQDRPGIYQITAIYPLATGGAADATATFNAFVRGIAIDRRRFEDLYPGNSLSVPNTFSETYKAASLGDNLVSVLFSTASFSGGAHGSADRTAILFDLARGRNIGLDALLTDPARAIPAISTLCKAKLRALASREGWAEMLWIDDPKMDADPAREVQDARNWFVQRDGVEILFGNYTIGPYAIGMHECRLSYAELTPWLNPAGPLAHIARR